MKIVLAMVSNKSFLSLPVFSTLGNPNLINPVYAVYKKGYNKIFLIIIAKSSILSFW